jgi:hypothetical protein
MGLIPAGGTACATCLHASRKAVDEGDKHRQDENAPQSFPPGFPWHAGKVEVTRFQYLGPRRHEVGDKRLPRIGASTNLYDGSTLRV